LKTSNTLFLFKENDKAQITRPKFIEVNFFRIKPANKNQPEIGNSIFAISFNSRLAFMLSFNKHHLISLTDISFGPEIQQNKDLNPYSFFIGDFFFRQ